MSTLAPVLQAFFTDRLIHQRQASTHTIAAYRDGFKLLLAFAEHRTGTPPSDLDIADLDAPLIGEFLDHLEQDRGNSARTRNARLAAVHSLFRYAALAQPQDAAIIQRVLAIPPKRFHQTLVTYLTEAETDALLAAPDPATWTGRRDHAMLALAVQSGLRVSELTALTPGRCSSGHRRPRQLSGQRPQTTHHPTDHRGHRHPARLAHRMRWPTHRSTLPDPPGHPAQPGRRPTTPEHPRHHRGGHLPHPHRKRRCPRTFCDTPPRCGFSTPEWTPLSSPSGSATRTSPPPRSTFTPTSHSKNEHSPALPRWAPHQAATSRQTRSSPSSNPCDYAEPHTTITAPARADVVPSA